MRERPVSGTPASGLSARELEVLGMAALGLTNREIGKRLDVSVHGVKFHLNSIYRKLGISNRTEAVVRYLAEAHDPRFTRPSAGTGSS